MSSCVARKAVVAKSVLVQFFLLLLSAMQLLLFRPGGNLISNSSSVWFIRKTVRKSYKVIIRSDQIIRPCRNTEGWRSLRWLQESREEKLKYSKVLKARVFPPPPSQHLPVGCSVRGEKLLIRFFQNCREHLKWISGHPNTTLPWDWKWEAKPPPPLLFCCCHFHFAYSWGSFWNWFNCYISDGNHK